MLDQRYGRRLDHAEGLLIREPVSHHSSVTAARDKSCLQQQPEMPRSVLPGRPDRIRQDLNADLTLALKLIEEPNPRWLSKHSEAFRDELHQVLR